MHTTLVVEGATELTFVECSTLTSVQTNEQNQDEGKPRLRVAT
jgi:hypothetical protein